MRANRIRIDRPLDSQVPILVEKPVGLRSADLSGLIGRSLPVIVGYNRRFYRTVREARREVTNAPPLLAHLTVPESITTPKSPSDNPDYLRGFFSNSVHALDLVRYIFGEVRVECVQRLENRHRAIQGLGAMLSTKTGSIVTFTANWGTPANFSLVLDRPGRRLELRPFEAGRIYEGLEVVEPSSETPIRTYLPKVSRSIGLDERDLRFKPGFCAQARALLALVRGEDAGPAARLEDAFRVLELAEELIGTANP